MSKVGLGRLNSQLAGQIPERGRGGGGDPEIFIRESLRESLHQCSNKLRNISRPLNYNNSS